MPTPNAIYEWYRHRYSIKPRSLKISTISAKSFMLGRMQGNILNWLNCLWLVWKEIRLNLLWIRNTRNSVTKSMMSTLTTDCTWLSNTSTVWVSSLLSLVCRMCSNIWSSSLRSSFSWWLLRMLTILNNSRIKRGSCSSGKRMSMTSLTKSWDLMSSNRMTLGTYATLLIFSKSHKFKIT